MFDDDDLLDGGDELSDEGFCDFESGDELDDGDAPEMEETAENLYYKSKSESVEEAEKLLRKVVELDQADRSEYGFKALKKIVKLKLKNLIPSDPESVIEDFKQMLTYGNSVSVNVVEKQLDIAVTSKKFDLMEELAQLAAESFLKSKNERAWFRINLKLVQLMLTFKFGVVEQISDRLSQLVSWCEIAPGVNNPKKEASLLEVLALQMQCLDGRLTGENGLRRLVSRASTIQSAISKPPILGTLHEYTGKVKLFEYHWSEAKQEFFDAFKNYDESGSPRRTLCLRYLVLAALLENSRINPFESPETKSLVSHEDIVPVVLLWNAFENLNVSEFYETVRNAFEMDEFANQFIPLAILSFQQLIIADVVKAYSNVRISFLAKKLLISEEECKDILVQLILDGKLAGSIDQTQMVLILDEDVNETEVKYNAMDQWSGHIDEITLAISKKVIKNRMD